MDGAPDGGGRNLAPRPMETVLAGTGACAAYDVVLILKRGRHDVRSCRVQVTSERAPTDPKVFTKIHLHFVVGAVGVPAAAVERAIALSHDTLLLGDDHARQDGGDHDQLRARHERQRSDVVGRRRHHLGGRAHRPAKRGRAGGCRRRARRPSRGSPRPSSSARRWHVIPDRRQAAGRGGPRGGVPPAARSRSGSRGSSHRRLEPPTGRCRRRRHTRAD